MKSSRPSAAPTPSKALSNPGNVRPPPPPSSSPPPLRAPTAAPDAASTPRPPSDAWYTGRRSSPAIARTKLVFPPPGGPWSKYPRRYGIPRSAYHRSRRRNARASSNASVASERLRITLEIGRDGRRPASIHSALLAPPPPRADTAVDGRYTCVYRRAVPRPSSCPAARIARSARSPPPPPPPRTR
eukprot:10508-Pelagococcus_subviridis.AAC.1